MGLCRPTWAKRNHPNGRPRAHTADLHPICPRERGARLGTAIILKYGAASAVCLGVSAMERRVFVSVTSDQSLDKKSQQLKAAIVNKIRGAGYAPQEFFEMGVAANLSWTFDNVDKVMRQCIGATIICFPRWTVTGQGGTTPLASAFQHYEGAVAVTLGLPLMIIAEDGLDSRGILSHGGRGVIAHMPNNATKTWINTSAFTKRFTTWCQELNARKDVFLGYCSKSSGTAAQIQLLLEAHRASVYNWAMDFRAGTSILQELETARNMCSCGIFLFSEDDPLQGTPSEAAPRDNVVFEAGHFLSSKGATRCLIIRVGKAKIPADLGGAIYIALDKTADVSAIDGKLAKFLKMNI